MLADLLVAMHSLHGQPFLNFDLLNQANIVLLPKNDSSDTITSFILLRLAPSMRDIISKNQSAFIKGRRIHDNFLYVCNMGTRYATKTKHSCSLLSTERTIA
jgi:hypothetical protein